MVATLVIFCAFTFPANQATNNWTQIPPDWEQLRWRWELSHAVNAVITFFRILLADDLVAVDAEMSVGATYRSAQPT